MRAGKSRGRPLRDRSNFWKEDGIYILKRAACDVLRKKDPTALSSNPDPTSSSSYVTMEDLISEAWIRSFRRGSEATLKKQMIWAKTHMYQAYGELRYEKIHQKVPHFVCRFSELGNDKSMVTSDDFLLTRDKNDSYWGVRCLDIWDMIQKRCTSKQQTIIALKASGFTSGEIAHTFDRTTSCLRQWMEDIETTLKIEYEGESNV